jgi:hypothetical protein
LLEYSDIYIYPNSESAIVDSSSPLQFPSLPEQNYAQDEYKIGEGNLKGDDIPTGQPVFPPETATITLKNQKVEIS